ncbi:MAG: flavodoxin family protein [Actinomycetota bacterium]
MKALVVYESLYGNTAHVGEAIADSLTAKGVEVELGPISKIDPGHTEGFDLLVVGGPTHAHGMSSQSTREKALKDSENTCEAPTASAGLREWMDRLPSGDGRMAAAFDTRLNAAAFLTGSAARTIARRLRAHGYTLLTGVESFLVSRENVLIEGEIAHATVWGAHIADRAAAGTAPAR